MLASARGSKTPAKAARWMLLNEFLSSRSFLFSLAHRLTLISCLCPLPPSPVCRSLPLLDRLRGRGCSLAALRDGEFFDRMPLSSAVSHRGVAPLPAHVSPPGPRYFGGTDLPRIALTRPGFPAGRPRFGAPFSSKASCRSKSRPRSRKALSTPARSSSSASTSRFFRAALAISISQRLIRPSTSHVIRSTVKVDPQYSKRFPPFTVNPEFRPRGNRPRRDDGVGDLEVRPCE